MSFGSVAVSAFIPSEADRELAAFTPSAERPDPSVAIPGIVIEPVTGDDHAADSTRPVYAVRPPAGGPHAETYAACDGVAHPNPVSDAEAVHSMEHGAVWITYDPVRATSTMVAALSGRVTDGDFLMLSPYPGLAAPLTLQAWGHRMALDSPGDPRFEQFIRALSDNPYTSPDPDAGCGPAA